jgi:hypothetical protein
VGCKVPEKAKARADDERADQVQAWVKEDNKRYYPQQAPPGRPWKVATLFCGGHRE